MRDGRLEREKERKREEGGIRERERGERGAVTAGQLCALKDDNPRCSSNLEFQQPMIKAAHF